MPSEYIEFLLNSEEWWLFFDKARATEKMREIEEEGRTAKVYRERNEFTVFRIKE